jgi:hypothetical protein
MIVATVQVVIEAASVPALLGIRMEFILFALTLVGVAVFHKYAMQVAVGGLAAILAFKLMFDGSFDLVEHVIGSPEQEGEWRTLLNLLGLLPASPFSRGISRSRRSPSSCPRSSPRGGRVASCCS